MVTKTWGPQQAYNGQISVDADEGVIVAVKCLTAKQFKKVITAAPMTISAMP